MIEKLLLNPGAPPPGIALETAKGSAVANSVAPEPVKWQIESYETMRAKYGVDWKQRRKPYGQCNCFGMAFASRRTSIYSNEAVDQILKDDGFRLLAKGTAPWPGDLVIYRSEEEQIGIIHVGVIVGVRFDDPRSLLPQITVISKWKDCTGEDVHLMGDVPYHRQFSGRVEAEIWTDRRVDLPHAQHSSTIVVG